MAKKRVLIVEDDAIISNFIQMKLEDIGYSVPAKARTGKQAIEYARKFDPDIILMDVMLEGEIDGVQAVEEISKYIDVPVIYLTASSDENTIQRLMKTEPHGFLIKPFDDRILFSAMQIAAYRHKTKKELFDTKELLRATLHSIDDQVFSIDMNGVFTHNHSGISHRLQFFQNDRIIGKSISEVFPPDVAKRLLESVKWVKDYKKPHVVEFSISEKSAEYWFTSKLTLRKDSGGKYPGITMVLTDITETRIMSRELLLSQEKLSEAQNIARLGSFEVFYKEKKFIYNDLYFQILGIVDFQRIKTFNDDALLEIIHPDDRSRYRLSKKQVIDERRTEFTIDFRIVLPDGETKYIHSISQLIYDIAGEPIRIINTIQDITTQKINEKLRHDVEIANKTAELKQRFFARLSHEIRNPIAGMTGLLQLLESSNLDQTQRDYIQAIKTSSNTLLTLLNDVLDYTRIEAGMMKITPVDFQVRNTIKNIHTFFIPGALEKGIQFSYFIDEDLPQWLMADESKLVQVISNFLSNALKFTDSGKVELRVSFSKPKKDNEVIILRIDVEDTGSGIAPEEEESLFIDFSQLENAKTTKIKGSGLGLSISKQLIEIMGGEIGVSSPGLNRGSMFWFTLPVIVSPHQPVPEIKQSEIPVGAREKLNCSVMLVEDMVVNQKVIRLILEEMGCKVTVASNGLQAVELFRETVINAFDIFGRIHYDIILMDLIMPVMDGQTATGILRKDYKKLPPIIVLTADESFAVDNKFLKDGFDDCIIKPVKAGTLYDKIRSHLRDDELLNKIEKFETFSIDDVDCKPVINQNTIDLIIKNATTHNFNIEIIFSSFFEDMERIYSQSLSAVEMNDNNALRLLVMTVKGLSGTIGASQLHATAKLMDRHIRNEHYDEAKALLPLLTEKYGTFKNKVKEEILNLQPR